MFVAVGSDSSYSTLLGKFEFLNSAWWYKRRSWFWNFSDWKKTSAFKSTKDNLS